MADVQTITVTNFGGRLTRKVNGDLNSGFAKFVNSFGYDPFSKPDNLTWFEKPVDITASITGVVLSAKPRSTVGIQYIYAVASTGNNANLYQIRPNSNANSNLDSASLLGTISANNPSFSYGASMDFFGASEKIYVSSDSQINSINFDGSGDTQVLSASILSNQYHPLRQFSGSLCFGNGNTIGLIGSSGVVTSSTIGTGLGNLSSQFNPPLPVEMRVHDLDVSIDGNYLLATASQIPNENILTVGQDGQGASASEGAVFGWNGSDATVTTQNSIPSYAVTSLQTYLNNNMFFSNDSFGASLIDGTNKLLTLQNNKPPLPNATAANANFLTWMNPENASDNSTIYGSLYYYGSLDSENQSGLWRVCRMSSGLSNGFVYQVPVNLLVNNKYQTVNQSVSSVITLGYGKHYFSTIEDNSVGTPSYKLYRFLVTSSGSGTPQLGVYETQTQLFSKKVSIKQVRVYCEPTASGNGFQIDYIGSDGNVISGSTSTYTFASGSDPTLLQGSLDRINFNPGVNNTYALGLRITNTGTTNMVFHKIEIDYAQAGE